MQRFCAAVEEGAIFLSPSAGEHIENGQTAAEWRHPQPHRPQKMQRFCLQASTFDTFWQLFSPNTDIFWQVFDEFFRDYPKAIATLRGVCEDYSTYYFTFR